jgi:CBS domain-containing protein/uncharacterized protein (DUF2267 family)
MSLEQFRRDRLVVLHPESTAHDAARAMENNHVGCVFVQDEGLLLGIVTDRDLALRIVGDGQASQTKLKDVMTRDPATVSIRDTYQQALQVMRSHHVRRVPLMDEGHLAGVVTLDDLILEGESVGDIVEAQLEEPAPAKPGGFTHPTRWSRGPTETAERIARHLARAEQTLHAFETKLQDLAGLPDRERAMAAFEVLASGIIRRLTAAEAGAFAAQLPALMRERLLDLPAGPDRSVSLLSIEDEMAKKLTVSADEANALVRRVAAALSELVSEGEVEHLRHQLPRDMRTIFGRGEGA